MTKDGEVLGQSHLAQAMVRAEHGTAVHARPCLHIPSLHALSLEGGAISTSPVSQMWWTHGRLTGKKTWMGWEGRSVIKSLLFNYRDLSLTPITPVPGRQRQESRAH